MQMMQMTTRTAIHPFKVVAGVGAALLLWGLMLAYSASPAHAEGDCSTTAGTTTCTFASTGSEDTFEVPNGVSSVHVEAIGAPGAVGLGGGPAGNGAEVSGDLTVTPGKTLYVNVGGAPTRTSDCFPLVDCIGGFNGGGSSTYGGGGGGASDVRTEPRTVPLATTDSRLIVAGGGGGSGVAGFCGSGGDDLGGTGGDAGSDGGQGGSCPSVAGGTGGKAGSQSAGGAGGIPSGQDGSLGQGGTGGGDVGGGGGGGYYGGGGGGELTFPPDASDNSAAGGGGGGSNLVPSGGPTPTIATGVPPSVTISYTEPTADTTPPVVTVPDPITNEATSPDGAVVTFNATAEDARDGSVDVTCTPPSGSTFPIGTTPVGCSATDAAGNTSTATFSVTVRDTTAPSITPPPNITVEATGPNGAVVQYGTAEGNSCSATDIADHNLTITYSGGLPSGSTFPLGTTTVTCTATDTSGNSSSAAFTVIVQDTTEPSVTCSVTPNKLSLPANNHKLVGITTTVQVTDSGSGPNGFKLVSVRSSQPDSGLARDDVAGDIQNWTTGTADTSGQLRAERYDKDRVYTLNYEGYDKAGNKSTCSATVTVPKKGG